MKVTRSHRKRGQNTAEYMLLLLLIGGGSIIAFKTFGKGIINRFASVTSIITGGAASTPTDVAPSATEVNFGTFDGQADGGSGSGTPAGTPSGG